MDKPLRHRINAGRVALKNQIEFFRLHHGRVASDWKEDETRVTFVDFAITEKLFAELRRSFPQDDYCSEEANPADEVMALNARFAWVLDPVDGTNNYALGMPNCAISLALLCDGEPVYGFIYDFALDTLFQGGPGQGVALGCEKRAVDLESAFEPHQGIVALQFPVTEPVIRTAIEPWLPFCRFRSFGSAAIALAYGTSGLVDGVIDTRVKVWDIAAGVALAKANGLEVHWLNTSPFPLRQFHVSAKPVPYFAGRPSFCRAIQERLEEASPAESTALPE